MLGKLNWDKIGTYASTICAVHCLITGVAIGLLSVAGLGFFGSIQADVAFLAIAVMIGAIAIFHGVRKHHSYKPAAIFVAGLVFVVLGHFVLRHDHAQSGFHVEDLMSTLFSVVGGLCFVLFHVVNMRLQHQCRCDHCSTGE